MDPPAVHGRRFSAIHFPQPVWWPVVRRAGEDVRLQVRLLGQTLRRFFTVVVLALTVLVLTGGLYLLPPAYRAFGGGDEARLATFHLVLLWKLGRCLSSLCSCPCNSLAWLFA